MVSALYVLQIRVQCCVHFFLGTLRDYYTNVCTCAHLRMCLLHPYVLFWIRYFTQWFYPVSPG